MMGLEFPGIKVISSSGDPQPPQIKKMKTFKEQRCFSVAERGRTFPFWIIFFVYHKDPLACKIHEDNRYIARAVFIK